jgi:hypothetical protein
MSAGGEAYARRPQRVIEVVLGLTLLGLWGAAFLGLNASSYWVDELWTLFVADHPFGAPEVVRRALLDVHPPAFYLLIHYWMRLFGDGEAATRSFSALCAVGASALFVASTGKAFSRAGRLFGAAAGASSLFWFEQSQNLRSYGLAMLVLTALLSCALAAKRQSRSGERVSLGLSAALAALGLFGAFIHYYLFLTVGLLYFGLLVSVPDLRFRATLIGAGLFILACTAAYVQAQRGHTIFTTVWFSNDPSWLAGAFKDAGWQALGRWVKRALVVLAAGLLFGLWRRHRPAKAAGTPEAEATQLRRWLAGLSLLLVVGLALTGLAISLLVQPSFSGRNLLIAAPCVWCLAAWFYDEAVSAAPLRAGLALAAAASALVALGLVAQHGRLLNRTEDWRGSARYVSGLPACRGRDIPVVLPAVFAPDTPFYRRFAEQDFYGRYYRGGGRLVAQSAGELAASRSAPLTGLLDGRAGGADPCPVLGWAIHDMDDPKATELAQALAARVGRAVQVRRFGAFDRAGDGWRPTGPGAYVFELAPAGVFTAKE